MESAESVAAAVKSASQRVMPFGGKTKAALCACDDSVIQLDMRALSGIVSYDPSEYLVSARAGTTIAELKSVLAERRQFLPFDPMFSQSGATLGGTVASGLSGSNRLLYGSLRDFVMEVQLVDGTGELARGGGKVVKNAAGFDLPKLVVGSYGRLGVLTEITLKVFPEPQATATLIVEFSNTEQTILAVQKLLAQPLPIAALDLACNSHSQTDSNSSGAIRVFARFAGPTSSMQEVLRRAAEIIGGSHTTIPESESEQRFWKSRAEGRFVNCESDQEDLMASRIPGDRIPVDNVSGVADGTSPALVRIATSLEGLAVLLPQLQRIPEVNCYHTAAGSTTWLMFRHESVRSALDELLAKLGLSAIAITGSYQQLQTYGDASWRAAARRIQQAIDPCDKFVAF